MVTVLLQLMVVSVKVRGGGGYITEEVVICNSDSGELMVVVTVR